MTFSEYSECIKTRGYFSLRLDDNRAQLGVTDNACDLVLSKWLIPLLEVCERVFVYRLVFKDGSYDATTSPRDAKPAVLSKTTTRVELDAKAMLTDRYGKYWAWALRHATIVVCIPQMQVPMEALAKECWDPGILMNLGAVVPSRSIQLAKHEAKEGKVCCVFSRDSYSISSHIFAPTKELLNFYKYSVMNCRFILKGLERELKPVRKKEMDKLGGRKSNPAT